MKKLTKVMAVAFAAAGALAWSACVAEAPAESNAEEPALGAEAKQKGSSCSPVFSDATPVEMKAFLEDKELHPVGAVETSREGKVKTASQRYTVHDPITGAPLRAIQTTCTTSCNGSHCTVSGCDPTTTETGGSACTSCSCSGDYCLSSCSCTKSTTSGGAAL